MPRGFSSPSAHQIERDFSHLMRTGKLAAPTIYNPGYVPPTSQKKVLNYQLCPSRETVSKKKQYSYTGTASRYETSPMMLLYITFTFLICFSRV